MPRGFTHESTHNESDEWYTPRHIFKSLGLSFDLDPCSPGAEKVPWIPALRHFTFRDNGLTQQWHGNVYVNPPYGNNTPRWFGKLALHGNGVGLVFSRTDTKWFHKYVPLADAICFIRGRVQFVPADKALDYANNIFVPKGGCGAASMLVAFGEENAKALFDCDLGLTLPVSKYPEKFRADKRFAGDKSEPVQTTASPYENLPRSAESGQGSLFDNRSL